MNPDWTMSTPVHRGEAKQTDILGMCVPTGANLIDIFLLYYSYSIPFSNLQDATKH